LKKASLLEEKGLRRKTQIRGIRMIKRRKEVSALDFLWWLIKIAGKCCIIAHA